MAQNLSSKTVSRINIFVFKRMVSFNTKYTFQRVMTQNMETHLQCYVSLYACWSISLRGLSSEDSPFAQIRQSSRHVIFYSSVDSL